MTVPIDPFREAMRRLAASVTILTTRLPDGGRLGVTATAVCSVSGDPPILLCCINQASASAAAFASAGIFAVNILALGEDDIASRFATPMDSEARFARGAWTWMETGAPILESAAAAFDCRIVQAVEMGSHHVFFGAVEAVTTRGAHVMPLLYAHGGYGGFHGGPAALSDLFWTPDWQVDDL
jgi:flavin reductase